jgi:hypothetical protein
MYLVEITERWVNQFLKIPAIDKVYAITGRDDTVGE